MVTSAHRAFSVKFRLGHASHPSFPLRLRAVQVIYPDFGRTKPYEIGCSMVIFRRLKAMQSNNPWLRVRSRPT